MKRFFLIAAMTLLVAGCGTTSDERIGYLKTGIEKATALSAEADKYVAILETQLTEADRILSDPATGIPEAAEVREVISKIQAEKDKAIARKKQIDDAIGQWKAQIEAITAQGSANLGQELQIIGQGLTVTAPATGPAAGYLALAGALLTALGAGIGKVYQSKKDAPSIQALPEIIQGVDDILKQTLASSEIQEKAKALLMLRQSTTTQKLVQEIKGQ